MSRVVVLLTKNRSLYLKTEPQTTTTNNIDNNQQSTMAKRNYVRSKSYAYKGWKANSRDGQFLERLFRNGDLSPAAMLSLIKERYPQFKKYKVDSFASGLRRLKGKLALNTRHAGDCCCLF